MGDDINFGDLHLDNTNTGITRTTGEYAYGNAQSRAEVRTINEVKPRKYDFELPDEVITVKFIPRKKGLAANVEDSHVIAGGMLEKAVKRFCAPLNQRNGSIKNVLTNAEKELLEQITGLNLSVYGDFWTDHFVKLYKQDEANKIDLSHPMGYINYKILLHYPDLICHEWTKRDEKPTYQFCITREGDVNSEVKTKLDIKKEAFKLYGKVEDDKESLIGILRLISNKLISENADLEWLQGQVQTYVDTSASKFVALVKDPSFDTKVLINKGVDAGVIIKKGDKYSTADGLSLSEEGAIPTFANAVVFLNDDANVEVRTHIEARINVTE